MAIHSVVRVVATRLVPVLCAAAVMMNGESRADEGRHVLFDFDTPIDARQWDFVNDDVMTGRPEGTFRVDGRGFLEFHGNLSLEDCGEFASIRSPTRPCGNTSYLPDEPYIFQRFVRQLAR